MRFHLTVLTLLTSACVVTGSGPTPGTDSGTGSGTGGGSSTGGGPDLPAGCATDDQPPIELGSSKFTEDLTLVDAPERPVDYLVTDVANVKGSLTIEPGVVIEFAPGAGLYIRGDGSVHSLGGSGECERVVLRPQSGDPRDWRGVMLQGTAPNELRNTDLIGGGSEAFNSNGDLGSVILWAGAALTLENVRISDSAADGLNVTGTDSVLAIEGQNVFTGHALAPMRLSPNQASAVQGGDMHTGNGLDAIVVYEGRVEGAHTWAALDVPYQISTKNGGPGVVTVSQESDLMVEAGAELTFEAGMGLKCEGNTTLAGAEGNPVRLRGVEPGAGTWRGVYFEDTTDTPWTLTFDVNYAQIDGAGGTAFNSNGDLGGVIVWADTQASVTNTDFSNLGTDCAVNAPYSGDKIDVSGSTTDSASILCDGP